MGGGIRKMLKMGERFISVALIVLTLFTNIAPGISSRITNKANAAQTTIDATAQAAGTSHIQSGGQTVFISDTTGYKFYRDSTGICVYSKTTNTGTSWGAAVTVDAQTDCLQIQVWYDKWTPNSASSSIHIITSDLGNDDLWYNRLDPGTDTLLLGSNPVNTTGAQAGSLTAGENYISISRGTDGTIYAVSNDGSNPTADSFIMECTVNCNIAGNWIETGTNPLDVASDFNILMPLANGNMLLINRDISLDDMRSKVWNNVSWSAAWTTIDANAPENATYDTGFAAAVSSTTPGTVYMAYIAFNDTPGTNDQIRTARYSGSTWATSTDVINSTTLGLTNIALGIDAANDDVYVSYSGRTTAATANTGNVYWKVATSSMKNWSAQEGPVNTSAADIYGVDLTIASDQRMYTSWFNAGNTTIYGDTIADVFPGIHASTTGTQTATGYASTTGFYVGGSFLLYNTYTTTNVTGITITEGGTIDGSQNISNVKLFYETDVSYPYDCESESYGGTESQFGSTDTNGFSGADGVSSFTGSSVSVSTTTSLCVYVVMDLLNNTPSGSTIDISIADPTTDVTTSGLSAGPNIAQNISGTTQVLNDQPTQMHFHWRHDNGNETTATSKTGGTEDTPYPAFQARSVSRLRIEVSNEGGSSTPTMQYRLEYAPQSGSCAASSGWVDVGATGGVFDMYDSVNLTEGNDTTNISVASGGVTDENTTFLTPNGGVKDISSQTGGILLSTTEFVELEYSIIATSTAPEGTTYCFRVSDKGNPLYAYNQYPRATISADVDVTVTGTQTISTNLPATNFHIGGGFVIKENTASRNVTGITISASGTIDAKNDIDNIKLLYELDTSAPYDCASESYAGTETQFGPTDTDGFSTLSGTSTFTGSVGISTIATMCVYVVFDTTDTAQNGETLDIYIANPSTEVTVSGGGSVSPNTARHISGITTFQGAVLTQTHYHWRNDTGTETTATSMTLGSEDTPVSNIAPATPIRLRLQVSNEGAVSSASRAFTLEYGTKVTTCNAVTAWINVRDIGGAWDMHNTPNLTDGSDTTNISTASGGVTDENTTFKTPNSAVKDASSIIASTTLSSSEFLEAEFSIQQSTDAGYETTYCFRLSTTQTPLNAYTTYPEVTTAPKRDFEIQQDTFTMTGTTHTLTAGVDYIAPAASTSAFIRITNAHYTGAGDSGGAANQNADDVTVHIVDPSNIETSVTFARAGAANNTRVSWEIIEFIGEPGSDNEMKVLGQSAVTYAPTELSATGTVVNGVTDDGDVVVFITGQSSPDTGRTNFSSIQSTSAWDATNDRPTFMRGDSAGGAVVASYAVVEFTGQNWFIQRSEHTYSNAGTTETEPITAVGSLSRTFIHTQKRVGTGLTGLDEFGHEVWLSSIGYVSYYLEPGATTPSGQTSVAWVIENSQITSGAMDVTRSNNAVSGGTSPVNLSISNETTLTDLTNASIFTNTRGSGTGSSFPGAIVGAIIASSTHYELWRSNSGTTLTYRTEIVEWPTAGLALKQQHYRFYVDNDTLTPTDPWPMGGVDLGEDTVLTSGDEPLGEGERIRIRMSLQALNASLPASTRAFRLQYGVMTTSCSAISEANWFTLGNNASSTVWRGYDAPGTTDGALLPSTLLLLSDVKGTFEEENDTDVNANSTQAGDEIEYDWLIEQNGSLGDTYYCFRMINADGTPLDSYSINYPQIRTASFTPRTQKWRWYDDETSTTPTEGLGLGENSTPNDIANAQVVKLRVTVKETKHISQEDTRFKLQFSEYANFSTVFDVVATSTCTATSTWCYEDGGGIDNSIIDSALLSDADSCVGGVGTGCGTRHESPTYLMGFRHEGQAATEYEFTIKSAGPRVNQVYYFRLYDLKQNVPVPTNTGEQYPSLMTEGASLDFTVTSLLSSTVVEGVTLDIDTTPSKISFGKLPLNTSIEGAHRLSVDANGTEGYKLLMMASGEFMTPGGATIDPISGTNAAPLSWATACDTNATGCYGYHTSDDTLEGGSARFSAVDTYARFSTTTLEEVSYSSQPVAGETTDIIFRLYIRQLQEAGQYETNIRYVSVPMF